MRSMAGTGPKASQNGRSDSGFTPDNTLATLNAACEAVNLDASCARLMRLGSNAVYRLAQPIVARISRSMADAPEARKTAAVARWLESVGYPAVRALPIEQPVVVGQRVATFWVAVSDDGDKYASASEVATLLRWLHSLNPPADLDLEVFRPFDRLNQRIEMSTWLPDADREFLTARLADLRAAYVGLSFALPRGVVHGDANVGNVLQDRNGGPVMIDLDGFAIGPREWDLIQTAIFYDRFDWHTREEYDAFVKVYGFDIMQWSGYPILRDIRELHMVTWLSQKADESERTMAEARKRIAFLRSGASRRDWLPY